jgi:prephenate dehydrogenase
MHVPESSWVLPKSTIAIVGGTGRMGRVLVRLFQPSRARIVVCSRNPRKAKRSCQYLGVKTRSQDDVQDADVVVVSVPIEKTVTTCKRLLKKMKPRSLLIDVTSVKKGIVNNITVNVPETIEYLSLHPLFGPETQNLKGENVLAINPKTGPLSKTILNFLSRSGLKTSHVTIDEHDRKTAITQALHHFAYASLATCMMKLMRKPDFQKYSTRSLKNTIELIQFFSNNLDTIMEIQKKNPYAADARRAFAQTVSELSRMENRTARQITSRMRMFGNMKMRVSNQT